MARILFVMFVMLMMFDISALGIGDEALELKTKYYNRKVFKSRFYVVDAKNQKKLKVLVFINLLGEDFKRNEILLDGVAGRKGISVGLAASSEDEIFAFMKEHPDFKYPLLYDRRGLAAYMERNIIFPYAFVINYENKIIWCGELIDLPGMLDRFENGSYDVEKNRRVSRYLAEMQNAMRIGSEYQLDRAAREIMSIDPGNLSCLRMRLFAFENTNRAEDAWAFLEEFKKKYPQEKNFYLLQIDMGARYPFLAGRGAEVGRDFEKRNLGSSEDRLFAAWMFLNNYKFNVVALEVADTLLQSVKAVFDAGTVGAAKLPDRALYKRALALLCYKRCDLSGAVKYQKEACDLINNGDNLQILKYYEKLSVK